MLVLDDTKEPRDDVHVDRLLARLPLVAAFPVILVILALRTVLAPVAVVHVIVLQYGNLHVVQVAPVARRCTVDDVAVYLGRIAGGSIARQPRPVPGDHLSQFVQRIALVPHSPFFPLVGPGLRQSREQLVQVHGRSFVDRARGSQILAGDDHVPVPGSV